MRILTVRQPWANAIIHGGKNVENRKINIAGDYRGPIAIHAAKNIGTATEHAVAVKDIFQISGRTFPIEPRGVIIGIVDLTGVHRLSHDGKEKHKCSPWAIDQPYICHLQLENPRPLAAPIPCTGALALRTITDPTLLAQLGQAHE